MPNSKPDIVSSGVSRAHTPIALAAGSGHPRQMSCKADRNARMLLTQCTSDILFRHAILETRGQKLQHCGGVSQQAHTFPEADRRALPRVKHKKKRLHS
jgi:hypothetical protein